MVLTLITDEISADYWRQGENRKLGEKVVVAISKVIDVKRNKSLLTKSLAELTTMDNYCSVDIYDYKSSRQRILPQAHFVKFSN